jgi:AraC-like DNA-binding protein
LTVLLDTETVPPEQRFELWCEAQRNLFHPLQIRRSTDRPFWARVSGHDLFGIQINRIVSEGSTVLRTPKTIAQRDPETLTVIIGLRGDFVVMQDGRTAVCPSGDITACDSSRPYLIESERPIEALTFAVPKSFLRPHVERLSTKTAVSIPGSNGRSQLVKSFLCRLVKGLEEGDIASDDQAFAESVVSMVRGLYTGLALEPNGRPDDPQRELLDRIKSYICVNLGDPTLDPESIARSHYISRRHLYSLFESEGPGVQGWIREQRLERCGRDLRDPVLRHETILTVATRWGFTSPSHFSRVFQAAYGCSPRDYRAAEMRRVSEDR